MLKPIMLLGNILSSLSNVCVYIYVSMLLRRISLKAWQGLVSLYEADGGIIVVVNLNIV